MSPAVAAWLADALTIIAVALLAASLAYGLCLALFPAGTLALSARLDRRISSRRAMRPLEIPRYTERTFYRHHRWSGALLLAGVIAFYAAYSLGFPHDTILAQVSRTLGRPLSEALLDGLTTFFLVANGLIGAFALVVIFRPSLLKPLEACANRWISTRKALRGAEESHLFFSRIVEANPRVSGVLILVATLYVVAAWAFLLT